MRILMILGILCLLPSCSTLEAVVVSRGNEAVSKAVDTSEFTICKAQSVGVLLEKYPGERLFDWARFCNVRIPGVSLDNKGSL